MTLTIKLDTFWVLFSLMNFLSGPSNAALVLLWLFMVIVWTAWLVIDVRHQISAISQEERFP